MKRIKVENWCLLHSKKLVGKLSQSGCMSRITLVPCWFRLRNCFLFFRTFTVFFLKHAFKKFSSFHFISLKLIPGNFSFNEFPRICTSFNDSPKYRL